MSCRRAREIDAAAYLVEPTAPEFAAFRAHYPGCPDCAAAVSGWSELERALRSGATDAAPAPHPEAAQLAAFEASPESLPAERWQAIDHHLQSCRRCADELAALRAFDFDALAATAPKRATDSLRELGQHLADGLRSLAGRARDEAAALGATPAVAMQSAEEAGEARSAPVGVLVALAGTGTAYPLFVGEARLGRGAECELRIDDDSLPRVAARLRASAEGCEVEAVATRPPLAVNGRPVERAALEDGDRLRLGGLELEFRRVGR